RLAGGVRVQGVVYEDTDAGSRTTGFLPQAYLSWGATSRASVYVSAERDFARDGTIGSGGAAMSLFGFDDPDKFQVGMTIEYARYWGQQYAGFQKDSWRTGLRGSALIAKHNGRDLAYANIGIKYDVDNHTRWIPVGVSIQF